MMRMFYFSLLMIFLSLLAGCSASKTLQVSDIERSQSVKLYLLNGEPLEGIVLANEDNQIKIVSHEDHQLHVININSVRQIQRAPVDYDYDAYPISAAEIEKHRQNRNTWGYALGGAVIGGLGGLAIGLPIWLAADNPPPYFIAGIGAVVGSILFTTRGIKKDREIAIDKVRYLRLQEDDLQSKLRAEEERLQELEKEKRELRRKLGEKEKKEIDRQLDK